jgi:hypothetical protein
MKTTLRATLVLLLVVFCIGGALSLLEDIVDERNNEELVKEMR